jgi:hypothetical protein
MVLRRALRILIKIRFANKNLVEQKLTLTD